MMRKTLWGCLFLVTGALAGCATNDPPPPAKDTAVAPPEKTAETGKIAITTKSPEAKAEYIKGRDLTEKLQVTDSIAHYEKAVALDPEFALAELGVANSAPTGQGFFEHLAKAVHLADKVSRGEKLLILAAEAGANGKVDEQKKYLDDLVKEFPGDQRAHFTRGNFYFGQQEASAAIEEYKKATEIDPGYSTAYNLLGYCHRQNGDYASAEKDFQKYIELIPKDPNPYDSYAELLLKMGRFDDSIAQYQKALAIDPSFLNAHQGIAMDLLLSGKADKAEAEIENITKKARTDGERRTALFALTVVHTDGGKLDKALEDLDKQIALGEKSNDVPAIAFDRGLKGDIFLEMGKIDDARQEFERQLAVVEGSTLSNDVKENGKRNYHYDLARLAIAKKDVATANTEVEECKKRSDAKNSTQVKQVHEVAGIVALGAKEWEKAVTELSQANQQNPRNLYRLCEAYRGKGDVEGAKKQCSLAASFNSLPQMNYALVRAKAKAIVDKG